MLQQLLKGISLSLLFATTAAAQCTDTLEVYGGGASCGTGGYACAYLWNGGGNASYLWSNGSTQACQQNLAPGTYSVTVTQALCTYTGSFVVVNDPMYVYDCSMLCDPAPANNYLEACPSAGTAPYVYMWNNGATTPVINNPTFGVYTCTVTDANGCTGTMMVNYQQYTPITVNGNVTDANCGNNGAIDLTITGGNGMFYIDWYDANWNWAGNTEDISNLAPGTYTAYIYDSTQCGTQNTYQFTVGGSNGPQIGYQVIGERCLQSDGVIMVSVSGFAGTPTYAWSNGATTATISGLAHGWYTVTITDGGACTITENIQVYEDSCSIIVAGYMYNASASGTCSSSTAWGMAYKPVILQPLGLITFTDAYGYYAFQVPNTGSYTVELYNIPSGASLLCPSSNSIAVNANTQGYFDGNDFYLTMPYSHDVAIDLYNYTTATPGFPLWTVVSYCNYGNQPVTGTFTYTYDAALTYDNFSSTWWGGSASLNNHDVANRVLTFDYNNLYPGACEQIWVDFNTAVATPLGSSVYNCVSISPTANDGDLSNNDDCDTLVVVGSWDPNSKHVSPFHTGDEISGGMIFENENQLEYTIHFQNMGTAPAVNVIVRDTLDANLVPSSIEGVQTSHPCNIRIEDGNILVFEFASIYLPDTAADYEGSNGHIHFYINRTAGLPLGTQIPNTAAIYFDFNPAVITNTVVSFIGTLSSTHNLINSELNVRTMPNPFRQALSVEYQLNQNSEVSIELYNALGERVQTLMAPAAQSAGKHQLQFATERLTSGVYFLNIITAQGIATQRIVKE